MNLECISDKKILQAISDKNIKKVALLSPSAAAKLAGKKKITIEQSTKKLTAVLKKIGFDAVFTTAFGADLFVVEAMTQFMERKIAGENLPIVLFSNDADEKYFKEKFASLKGNFTDCKNMYQMTACLAKTRYADLCGVKGEDVFTVIVAPCAFKNQLDFSADIDAGISLCEIASLCDDESFGASEENLDAPFDMITGSGAICEIPALLCEACLRSITEAASGKELKELEFNELRGKKELIETEIKIKDETLSAVVACEKKAAEKLFCDIEKGKKADIVIICTFENAFIDSKHKSVIEFTSTFEDALCGYEKTLKFRKPHDNKDLKVLYNEFLDRPASDIAKKILHN